MRSRLARYLIPVVCLGLFAATVVAAGPKDRRLSRKVDLLFAEWNRPGAPGAAVAVVRDGAVVHARGYGRANLEHDIPITPSTVFDIASVSKQFAGLGVAMLVEQGKLSLDDDYRKHLPEMPDFGTTITIGHLLHHTSGIRDWPGTLAVAGWAMSDVISYRQILTMAEHQRDLNFYPGDEYSYSNTNYNLLAETISRVSGKSFRGWTREHLFKPLGMNSTHFYDSENALVENRAYGYYRTPDGRYRRAPNNLTALGSSSLYTTVEDLARWVAHFDDPPAGRAAAIELMHSRGALNDGETVDYAFGVSHGDYRDKPIVSHSGGWASFRTVLVRFPEERFAIIVLSNFAGFDPGGMAERIADLYLFDGPEQDEGLPAMTSQPPDLVELAVEDLERFTGHYWFEDAQRLRQIYLKDGKLVYSRGGSESPLLPVGNEEFRMLDVPIRVDVRFQVLHGQYPEAMIVEVEEQEPSRMQLVQPADTSARALAAYAGTYRSDELDATYVIDAAEAGLTAHNRRHGTLHLTPTIRNRFYGDRWFFDSVRFLRDEEGRVTGFEVSTGRSRNLHFDRE